MKITGKQTVEIEIDQGELVRVIMQVVLRDYLRNESFDDAGLDWYTDGYRTYIGSDKTWLVSEMPAVARLVDAANILHYGRTLEIYHPELADDALFIGAYPGGIVYADRTTRGPGFDYARVAFLPYKTLVLEVKEGADPELVRRAKAHASQYKAGDKFEISATGQYVILGERMKEIKTLTLEEIARRQQRFEHLCKLLKVQERPDDSDGYTAADWEANRQTQRDAEDRRMQQRGYC